MSLSVAGIQKMRALIVIRQPEMVVSRRVDISATTNPNMHD